VFDAEVIELCVRWYITYRLSYRDLVEIMAERRIQGCPHHDPSWVLQYVPEYDKRWNRLARPLGTSWRVDETYLSVRGCWHYLYRAVDKHGKTTSSSKTIAQSNGDVHRWRASNHSKVPRSLSWGLSSRIVFERGSSTWAGRIVVAAGGP
jgi:hypothetical protein